MKSIIFANLIHGVISSQTTSQILTPTTTLKVSVGTTEAVCKKYFFTTSGNYGLLGQHLLATKIAALCPGVVADDVDFNRNTAKKVACTAAGLLELNPVVLVPSGSTTTGTTCKDTLNGKTKDQWVTMVQAVVTSMTEVTPAATVSNTNAVALVQDTPAEVTGFYGKLTMKITLTAATGKCAKYIATSTADKDATKGTGYMIKGLVDASRTTANTETTKQIEYDQVKLGTLTCTGEVVPIQYTVTHRPFSKTNIDKAKTQIAKWVKGTAKDTADSWWKWFENDADGTVHATTGPVIDNAVAVAKQTATQTVSGTFTLTVGTYTECNKLKARAVILAFKTFVATTTSSRVKDVTLTVTCKNTAASVYVSVTSLTGVGGSTLATEVKTALAGVANWGNSFKTEADKILLAAATNPAALTACTGPAGSAVTWTSPTALVTAQALDAMVHGSVVYTASNRADCEDIKSRQSEILKKVVALATGAVTSTSNKAVVTCLDKTTTLTYDIKVAKAAATTSAALVITLNSKTDTDWKKVITDSLAVATAITLDSAANLVVTTINAAVSKGVVADSTSTITTTTVTTTYVAMSTVKGQYTTLATESDCYNMKDQHDAVAKAIDAKATTTSKTSATVACAKNSRVLMDDSAGRRLTANWKATIDYTIMLPTAGTPTPAKVKELLDAVTAAKWQTDVAAKVGAVTGVATTPTLSSWTTVTKATIASVTTPKPPTTSYTGSSTVAVKQKITGTLKATVGTQAQCDKMKTTDGVDAIKTMLADSTGGAVKKDKVAATVTCGSRRRLSDGRRMATVTATIAYTMETANKALGDAAKASLTAVTNDSWKTKLQAALVAKGITGVTVSGVAATAPTSTSVHEVSSATGAFVGPCLVFTAILSLLN